MAYDFKPFKQKIDDITKWLHKELANIRTGRASVAILDSVMVESYGAKSPLNQCASISIEDPKTIRITPWDKALITVIEKGISLADIGVSTSVDEQGVRVIFPSLTTETREKLVKQAKAKIEETKVSIRNERSKIVNDIQDKQKAGAMSEDEAKREKDQMQKIVDETVKSFDEIAKKKEQEIMS